MFKERNIVTFMDLLRS